jgi:DNA polymerase-3 subunit alpha
MGIEVLGPHVNESGVYFSVNEKGQIRFGLGAIKGAGDAAVAAIIQDREVHGPFKGIFEFARRMNSRALNKKTYECLAFSGAFDCFTEFHRRQYTASKDGDVTLTEKAIRYAARVQQEAQSSQASLFGASTGTEMPLPRVDPIEPFSEIEKLQFEKDVVGVYISGHPLDNYDMVIRTFVTNQLTDLNNLEALQGKDCKFAGIVSSVEERRTKTGNPFGRMTMEDYSGAFTFTMFGKEYLERKLFFIPGNHLFLEGTVMRNTWGEQNLEYRIRNIELLNELATKKLNGIALRLSAETMTNETLDRLDKILKKNSGKSFLKISVKDANITTNEMPARLRTVKPSNALIRELMSVAEVGVITDRNDVRWLSDIRNKPAVAEPKGGTISPTFMLDTLESQMALNQ